MTLRLLILLLLAVSSSGARSPVRPEERVLIVVSIDGMRWDYLQKYAPPRLLALMSEGVHVQRLRPTFPSETFPNHYTLVTGLRVARHGILGNEMFDPTSGRFFRLGDRAAVGDSRWWGGEPIWVTAQRQGRRSACMFWPGSEAEIKGVRPTYWSFYDHDLPPAERITRVLNWLDLPAAERPAIITLYFAQVDDAGHRHGPDAPETRAALLDLDQHIGRLVDGLRHRQFEDRVHLVITSDHGMAAVSPERIVLLDDAIDPGDVQVDFTGPIAGVRPPPGQQDTCVAALRSLPHVRVLEVDDLSPALGYGPHPRAPDILVIADEGWRVYTRHAWENNAYARDGGDHGFDPAYGSMDAVLIAWGAGYRRGERIQIMDNVHVYELLCATLGLQPAANDGDRRLAEAVLVPSGP